jgi:hypothetical protein
MLFFYSLHRDTNKGPRLRIDCGRCGVSGAAASSRDLIDTIRLLFVIPFRFTNTFVTCQSCGAKHISQLCCQDLKEHRDADVTPFVSYHVSFVVRFLAVMSLLLCLFPFLGLALSLIAVCSAYKTRGWPRKLAMIAVLISGLVTAAAGIAIALDL